MEYILDSICADDKSDQVRSHHHDEIEHCSYCAYMSIPRLFSVLKRINVGQICAMRDCTLDAGKRKVAMISGRMKRLTSQPQARSLKDKSCHNATKEKTRTVVKITFFVPPRGI